MDECGKTIGVTTRPKDQLPSTNSNRLIERNTIFCGIRGWKGWAWPLAVIGTNSIAAYLIAHLWDGFIERALVPVRQDFCRRAKAKSQPTLAHTTRRRSSDLSKPKNGLDFLTKLWLVVFIFLPIGLGIIEVRKAKDR